MNKNTLFLLLVLITGSYSLYEEHDNIFNIQNLEDIQKIILGIVEHTSSVIFWHKDCEKCRMMEPMIEQFAENMSGMVQVYTVDCGEIWSENRNRQAFPMCNPEYTKHLPMLSFFEPPLTKINPITQQPNQATEHKYEGMVGESHLAAFARKIMPAYRDVIKTEEEWNKFIGFDKIANKVVLYTQKNETTSLYKGLTATFRGRLKFAEILKTSDVKELKSVEQFPSLVVFVQNEDGTYKKEQYEGELKIKLIEQFLSKFASAEKYHDIPETKPNDNSSNQQQNQSQDEFDQPKGSGQAKPDILQLLPKRYEKSILGDEKAVLIHVRSKEDEFHPLWEESVKKFGQIFLYYDFVVETPEQQTFAQETLFIKSYPSIKFLPFGTVRKPTARLTFTPSTKNMEDIIKDISDEVEDHTNSVNQNSLQMQLSAGIQDNKVVLIMFHTKDEVNLSFRAAALNSVYKQKFKFLNYKNPAPQVMTQFNIRQLPRIVALFRDVDPANIDDEVKQNEVKVALLNGHINYSSITQFLETWIEMDQGKSSQKVVQITNQAELNRVCKERSNNCFIALLNGHPKERDLQSEEETRLQANLQIVEKVKDRYGNRPISFGWIDAVCHGQLIPQFDLPEDSLPNFISLQANKQRYSTMIGTFDQDSLNIFVEKSLKGHVEFRSFEEDIQINEQDCVEEHQIVEERREQQLASRSQPQNDDFDDQLMKEILEENRLKQEQIEKELKAEKKDKKQKKKKAKDDL